MTASYASGPLERASRSRLQSAAISHQPPATSHQPGPLPDWHELLASWFHSYSLLAVLREATGPSGVVLATASCSGGNWKIIDLGHQSCDGAAWTHEVPKFARRAPLRSDELARLLPADAMAHADAAIGDMAYADERSALPEDEQYAAAVSSPLVLAMAPHTAHDFSTALGQTDAIIANRYGLAALVDSETSALQ